MVGQLIPNQVTCVRFVHEVLFRAVAQLVRALHCHCRGFAGSSPVSPVFLVNAQVMELVYISLLESEFWGFESLLAYF